MNSSPVAGGGAEPFFGGVRMNEVPPPRWMEWGHLDPKPPSPAPTIVSLGCDTMSNLARADFNRIGFNLRRHGFQCVSTDSPCYGFDLKPGEKEGIEGWRERLEKGEPILEDFASKTSHFLDHLIREGYTDPERVVASGHSRGAFLALHWAALEPRVKCVLAFSPLTDPGVLKEFSGMRNESALRSVAIHHQIEKLADRAVWCCLGNRDGRVDTETGMRFMRELMDAGVRRNGNKPANIELHLTATIGHATYSRAQDDAAAWVLAQMVRLR